MKYIESLASYVPGLIVDQLLASPSSPHLPWRQEYETVCVFCDVSGFTALSEAMQLNGKGAEGLAKHLNSYFSQMVRLIASEGGDVFKFAGDAMIVLWPESDGGGGGLQVTARRAAQCAFAIQKNLHQCEMEAGVSLSVKIGIGVGRVSVLHVGGTFNRVEYLAVGEPLMQAFSSEGKCVSGQVVCSKDVWKLINEFFSPDCVFDDGYVRFDLTAQNKLVAKSSKMKILQQHFSDSDPVLERKVKSYVAGAVLPNLKRDSPEDEQWGNELRGCTVMFVNLGLKESHMLAAAVYDEAMVQVHEVLVTTQQCIYQYEGSINKFLLDDKGSTLIACFGLPPLAHDDDPSRAVLASLLLCQKLFELGLVASIGITTGDVFCGVVGSKTRREYTVLGDSVNLSARLMQKAGTQGGGVLCDYNTRLKSGGILHFNPLGEIYVKGKSVPVHMFQPYPSGVSVPAVKNFRGLNPFEAIHKQQLQNASIRKTFPSLEGYFTSDSLGCIGSAVTLVGGGRSGHGSSSRISAGTTRRSSMAPSFGIADDSSASPGAMGLIGHVRKGGHGFRTRKSIVRCGDVLSAANLKSLCPPTSPMGGRLSPPAASSSRLPSPQRRGSVLASYRGSSEVHASHRHEIHIIVPTNLSVDTLEANELRPIGMNEVSDFNELRSKAYELALSNGYITDEIEEKNIRLNVAGTRFFLPVAAYSMQWLQSFYREAKSGFTDNWQVGDPIDLIVFSKRSMRSTQSRLSRAHCVLLEKKIALLESSQGSVTLVEGGVGVGKTHLMMKFISDTMFNTCPIYFSPASSYSTSALGPFEAILRQHLDAVSARRGKNHDRTSVLCGMLRVNEELYLDSPLLDSTLGTQMTERLAKMFPRSESENVSTFSRRIDAMSNEEMSARRFRLYLYLILCIGADNATVIILDDAHNLDDDSWALVLVISLILNSSQEEVEKLLSGASLPKFDFTSPPKLMIVATFRPLATHRSVFKGKPVSYDALSTSSSVSLLKLDGLPPEEVEELLVSTLHGNISGISEELYKLVELKCMSNPWMIKHLIEALVMADPPVLCYHREEFSSLGGDDDSRPTSINSQYGAGTSMLMGLGTVDSKFSLEPMFVDLVPDFTFEQCPLPHVVAKSFGTVFDRLNSCQRMILKTACHIGKQFTWAALWATYPLDGHKHRLNKEMDHLLAIGMLVEIPNTNKTALDRTYHFISDFLIDFITVLMLKDQREKISSYVAKYHTDIESEQRKKFIKQSLAVGGSDGVLKIGLLEVEKEIATSFWKTKVKRRMEGHWKTRFCVINHAGLSMFRDKHHFDTSPHTATQIIHLRGASAHVEPNNLHGEKEFVFRVDACSFEKEKHKQLDRRSFILNGSSDEDMKSWIYMLKYAIEACEEMENDIDEMRSKSFSQSNLSKDDSKGIQDVRDVGDWDAKLAVTVVGTDELLSAEVFGARNCYICCSVASEQHFTCVSFDESNKHTWNDDFYFYITRQQWAQEQVILSARKKDIMMTDDVLGTAKLDIRSLSLENLYEETMWLDLEKSGSGEVDSVGKICIEVKLDLCKALAEEIRKTSVTAVQEDIVYSINEGGAGNSFHIPGRINTLDDISHFFLLAKTVAVASKADNGNKKASLRRRLSSYLDVVSENEPQTIPTEKASMVAESSKEMMNHIEDLLKILKAPVSGGEMIPTDQSGSVNKMWVCRELRGVLMQARRSSPHDDDREVTILNPFEGVLEQAGELDLEEQAWLTHYSHPSTASHDAISVNVEKESSLHKRIRRASITGVVPHKKSGERQPRRTSPVRMHLAGEHHDHSLSMVEPDIFDPTIGEGEGYYILDEDDVEQGPFTAREIHDWLCADFLHPQVFIRHGSGEKNDHFFPLAVYSQPLHRIVCQSLDFWPESSISHHDSAINDFCSWNFNIWDVEPYELLPLSMLIMSSLGLSESFGIDAKKWRGFMSRVTTHMTCHNNPYHNFYHVSDVAQTCFVVLTHFEGSHLFLSHEILSLMVSSFAHDLDHPGCNNAYQVNRGTELAIRYNDVSVLENHHCALAFEVINSTQCGIFDSLDATTRRSVRKLMIAIILATDMSFHFALQADVAKLASRDCFRSPAPSPSSTDTPPPHASLSMQLGDGDRETLLKVVLHVSDISNSAKSWDISKKWSDLVCEEFFAQGELEKREGLPVTPSMDRNTTFQDELSLNFTDFIIAPYFFAMSSVLPKLSVVVEQIKDNRAVWQGMLMTRLQHSTGTSSGVEEAVSKWEKREKLFLEALHVPAANSTASNDTDRTAAHDSDAED